MREEGIFNKIDSNYIRGAAVLVFWHHLFQFCPHPIDVPGFGHFAVALFFMISGYGLQEQVKKDEVYLQGFLWRRFFKIYIPFLYATVIYIAVRFCVKTKYTLAYILQALIGYKIIVNFSWYIFAQLLMYFLFWAVYRFIKIENLRLIGLYLCTCTIIVLCMIIKAPAYWYVSLLAFPFGVMTSVWQTYYISVARSRKCLYFSIILIILLVCLACYFSFFSKIISDWTNNHVVIALIERLQLILGDLLFVTEIALLYCKYKFKLWPLDRLRAPNKT